MYKSLQSTTKDSINRELFLAAHTGDTCAIASLLDSGANIHSSDDLALRWAASSGHTDAVALLLDRGANIHVHDDCVIWLAAQNGHTTTVALLLDRGANIHAYDDYALHWAARNGHSDTVSLLILRGADIHSRSDKSFRYAVAKCHTHVDHGANIDDTPLCEIATCSAVCCSKERHCCLCSIEKIENRCLVCSARIEIVIRVHDP